MTEAHLAGRLTAGAYVCYHRSDPVYQLAPAGREREVPEEKPRRQSTGSRRWTYENKQTAEHFNNPLLPQASEKALLYRK